MISRALLLTGVIGLSGFNLMPTNAPAPMTAQEIQQHGKKKIISNLCNKKKKSKKVKELCERWQND